MNLGICALLLSILLIGCSKPSTPSYLPLWPRTQYKPGGSNALVYFVIYGALKPGDEVSAKTYRTAGLPPEVLLTPVAHTDSNALPFTDGIFTNVMARQHPALFEAARSAPGCVIFEGEVTDPPNLNYMRNIIGLIMFSLDHGGVAVLDVQQLKLFDRATWRKEMFEPQPLVLQNHVLILFSEEPNDTRWYHTRGLRKFGRPDLSWHQLPATNQTAALELFNRLISLQVDGGLIPEHQDIRMPNLPPGLTCHHAGTVDDPDFNNVHIEIQWPEKK